MKIQSATRFRVPNAAPALTFALLVLLPAVFPNRTIIGETAIARQRSVARAIEHAPHRIGEWISKDVDVPPAATRLLRPNAILSRRFWRLRDDMSLDLLLVHCTDARDMGGHYPPICYPSSGWSAIDPDSDRESELTVAGRTIPVRVYEFRRIREDVREVRVRVLNVFILPNGETTTDIGQIRKLAERLVLTAAGVAQLQIVTSANLDEDQVAQAASEILSGMPELLIEMRLTNGGDNDRN